MNRATWINLTVCLLVVGASAPPSFGQRRRRKVPVQPVKVQHFSGEINIEGEFRDEERTSSGGATTTQSQRLFEESLKLKADGYFYHPNLVEWFAAGRFGLEQNREEFTGERINSTGTVTEYDLSALILREKDVTFRPFALATRDRQTGNLTRQFTLETHNQGLEINTKGSFPVSLLVETLQREELDSSRDAEEQTRRLFFKIADRRNQDWLTQFTFEREDTDEMVDNLGADGMVTSTQDLSTLRDEFHLSNNWRFGPGKKKSRLSGSIRGIKRTGFYVNDRLTADQRLQWVHCDTFETFYSARYSRDQTEGEDNRQQEGEIGFIKRFYESLEITGLVRVRDSQFVDGSERTYRGSLDFIYRKKTPIGKLTCSLALARELEEEESSSGVRTIRDEEITLSGTTFEELESSGVVDGSITVMNDDRTIVYDVDDDYEIQTIGLTTEIRRVIGGDISDGQTVLVDYSVRVARQAEFVTDDIRWRARLKLKDLPLAFYTSVDHHDRQLAAGDDPGNLEAQTTWLTGVELDTGDLNATLEHEIIDRVLSPPTTETRFDARYRKNVNKNVTYTVGGNASHLQYQQAEEFGLEPGRDYRDVVGFFGQMKAKLAKNVLLRVEGSYDWQDGNRRQSLARLKTALEWRYGLLDFSIEGRYDVFEEESSTGTESAVLFTARRRF